MWLLWEHDQQAARNQRALAELGAANRRLEATIAENEGLHQQLLAQAREAGMLDERQRMAREIHDTLAQGLTGIVTQLQAAEQAARDPGRSGGLAAAPAAATRLARDSLTEARRSVDALRPEPLEGCRLSEALAGVAERWSALNGDPGAGHDHRHGAADATRRPSSRCCGPRRRRWRTWPGTRTRRGSGSLSPTWECGRARHPRRRGGLRSGRALALESRVRPVAMRQRIAGLSGTLQVESEPGGGTAVSACVPTVAESGRS